MEKDQQEKPLIEKSFDVFGDESNSMLQHSFDDSDPSALKSGYFDRNKLLNSKGSKKNSGLQPSDLNEGPATKGQTPMCFPYTPRQ